MILSGMWKGLKYSQSQSVTEQAIQEMVNIVSELMEETPTSIWFEGLW